MGKHTKGGRDCLPGGEKKAHSSRTITSGVVVALLAASALLVVFAPPVRAAAPPAVLYNLPAGSDPESLASDGTWLYYFSHTNGNIFKVNPTDGTYSTISTGAHAWTAGYFYHDPLLPSMLFMVDDASDGGGMYSYNLGNSTLTKLPFESPGGNTISSSIGQMLVAGQCPIGHYNQTLGACDAAVQNFWYTAHAYSGTDLNGHQSAGMRFDKIEYLKDVTLGNPPHYSDFPYDCSTNSPLCNVTGPYLGLAQDHWGDVFVSAQGCGCVLVYNATQNSMSKIAGFTSPAGLAISGSILYVAQQTANGGIAKYNLHLGLSLVAQPTLSCTPFGVTMLNGHAVWGCSSGGNVCSDQGLCSSTSGEAAYYLLPLGNGNLAFGYTGSAGIGIASGLTTVTSSTTTTAPTTTSTTACNSPWVLNNGVCTLATGSTFTSSGAASSVISGFAGATLTFTDNQVVPETVNVYFVWLNSQNQVVNLDARLGVVFTPGQTIAFTDAFGVQGVYTVKAFVQDMNGNALSPTYQTVAVT